ncbi:MAG: hypothetical protein LH475_06025 [Cryobacterium sp.]|uniref:hypothetical protein n=1 Tax=Cryobacterium sp. TaxID=1926290 RepID=UPI00229DD916|nr:hypothetical protein [Cryobacterium sp.]MCY7404167.1 hypothetical protein [Cryobacterium sp.]
MTEAVDQPNGSGSPALASIAATRELKLELTRFMLSYKFASDEMLTKMNILKEEFSSIHDYSPIEHVSSNSTVFAAIFRTSRAFASPAVSSRTPIAFAICSPGSET